MSNDLPDNEPRLIDRPDGAPDWGTYDKRVQKIIIGQSPDEAKKQPLSLAELPDDLATRFPQLTYLYLWNCAEVASLPALPSGLLCLDLRGCRDLAELPELPTQLRTLDLGGCQALRKLPGKVPPKLERFYFDGCSALKPHHVQSFCEALQPAPVVEIDGSDTSAVTNLSEFPKTHLRKLVLRGCPNLSDASGIGEFPVLEHLNLGGCTELKSLPDLPPNIRYLELFGATALKLFRDQTLAPYDLGTKEGLRQNVAKAFKTRKKYGEHLDIMPHAKLLLMGDGRVGKTTLAKRLQWTELSAEDKVKPKHQALRPVRGQLYTNSVEFFRWETGIFLPEKADKLIQDAAEARGITLRRTAAGDVFGGIRIWDFGGQEIYHNTHRLFAGEGSVFLLVWCDEPLTPHSLPPGARLSDEVWKAVNEPKGIEYWLDYIYSLRPNARVALVRSLPRGKAAPGVKWRDLAGKYGARKIDSFEIDGLGDSSETTPDYRGLTSWIREECGREADRIGLLQPKFFRTVADKVDEWLRENSEARASGGLPKHLLCDAELWANEIGATYAREFPGSSAVPTADDIATITNYLHDAGYIFYLRAAGRDAVLIDQQWAAGVIYDLLDIEHSLWTLVCNQGGYFTRRQLEEQPRWKGLNGDLERSLILDYMLSCGVITRLAAAERNVAGEDIFLAADKWLLPPYDEVKERVDATLEYIRSQGGTETLEKFEFEKVLLNEFDFRRLHGLLAQEFGTGAIYFREGIFARQAPEWCFLVTWNRESRGTAASGKAIPRHMGRLEGRLIARKAVGEELHRRVSGIFYGEDSPLRELRPSATREVAAESEFRKLKISPLRPDQFQVGFSTSGKDREVAQEIYPALSNQETVDWYEMKRPEQESTGVFDYMKEMVNQPTIVLLLSKDFLAYDPKSWHCAWELADAVQRLADGRRTTERTIVIYRNSKGFNSRNAERRISRLFERLSVFFGKRYQQSINRNPPERWSSFDDDKHFAAHFAKAAGSCAEFFRTRTTKGNYFRAIEPGEKGEYDDLVKAVKRAVEGS